MNERSTQTHYLWRQILINGLSGLLITAALFFTISLSLREESPPEVESKARISQAVQLVPPQPLELSQQVDETRSSVGESIKFNVTRDTPDVKMLATEVRPVKTKNILKKGEFDLSKFVVKENIENMVVYESREVDQKPDPIFRPMPKISSKKKETVQVMFVVNDDGKVGDVYVLDSSNTAINKDVLQGVETWKFYPARKSGKPVRSWVKITIIINPGSNSLFSI